jgi:hypothetical protein
MRLGIGIGIDYPRGGGGESAPATPLTLHTGVKIWLDPEMGLALGPGGGISAWYDQSGFNNDFFQPVESPQAAYEETGYAGKPSVRFDGVDDNLVNYTLGATLPGGLDTPFSLYLLLQYLTAVTGTAFGAGHHSDTDPYLFVYYNATGTVWSANKRDNGGTLKSVSSAVAASLNKTLLEVHHNGADNCVIVANGVESPVRDLNVGNTALSRLSLGALVRTAITSQAHARIAGLVLASVVSSADERTAMRAYYTARYP